MHFRPAIRLILALILAFSVSFAYADGAVRARYLGSFPWTMDKPWFGGWSGIELSADGQRMTAITDRGFFLRAEIRRDGDQITGIKPRKAWRLKASTGNYLTSRIIDSEGLAVEPNGAANISFEGITRVSNYVRPAASARVLTRHKEFRGFARNKSLEALAIDQSGRLYAIPEQRQRGAKIRVFVLDDDIWSIPFTLNGGGGFLPVGSGFLSVGADFGPEGRLYLLERAWSILGFRSRVRRWDIVEGQPMNEQLLVQTSIGTHDNLEGLAVWRDDQGRTRLTMISDDNFRAGQRTEIVEYAIQE